MNDLKILLKNNFNLFVGRFQGKSKRKSYSLAVFLLILGILAIVAVYSYQAYLMFNGLNKLGLGKVCVFHGVITSLAVVVIIGLMRVSGNITTNDSDLLLSLPIKKSAIIISKTINKYIFDLFFVFVLFMPYSILYLIYNGFNSLILICSIFVVLFLPLLSVGISYIFDFIIARLFNQFKSGKLLKSLISVSIYVIVLALMLLKTYSYGTVDPNQMEAYFSDRFFSNMILNFVLNTNLKSIIFFFSLTILPFIIGLILYSLNFGKSFSRAKVTNKNLVFSQPKSNFKLLFKKEINTYLTTVPWFVNTIIGPVMMLAFSILLLFTSPSKILASFGILPTNNLTYAIFTLILCALVSTTQISCCSVSLEGKQLWILKSCPINIKNLLLSKALLHFTILEPFLIISFVIISIILKLNFVSIIVLFCIPTLLNLICAFGGVLINIYFPHLDYDDETKVVKQSLSVLLSMVFSFVLTIIPIVLYLIFSSLSVELIVLITSILYALVFAIILILLFTKGVEKFKKL